MIIRIRPKSPIELVRMFVGRAWEVVGAIATFVGLLVVLSTEAQHAITQNAAMWVSLIAGAAVVVGAQRLFQPDHVTFKARGRALEVEVKVGDLFSAGPNIVIPVNDFFDSSLGAVVSEKSVHGQFLKRQYPNREAAARTDIDNALASKNSIETIARAPGASRRFSIGETALVSSASYNFILLALSQTNAQTHKTEASLTQYVTALEGLWTQVRDCCNHGNVALPLMGTKTGRVGIDKRILLDLILASAIRADGKQPVASKITLTLQPEDLQEVDLFDIRRRFA